jgi:hypothetical protein
MKQKPSMLPMKAFGMVILSQHLLLIFRPELGRAIARAITVRSVSVVIGTASDRNKYACL